jgi:pyruvate formate lyase activating enzyme
MIQARWWTSESDGDITCHLCPHTCRIADGKSGRCRARSNRKGVLYADTYGRTVTVNVDPIEKKPLYHFLPASDILSIGHNSCNLSCRFCQNASISQETVNTSPIPTDKIPGLCRRYSAKSVAFTYTEPVTGLEWVIDVAKVLKDEGIRTVLVTNGYVNPEPLQEAIPFIDAMNIDLKAFTEDFYKSVCGATLQPVLETIRLAVEHCHVELTTLLVTGENDSEAEIRALVDFVADLNPDIPLHFSRYFPQYRMPNPPTPPETLSMARDIARNRMRYVYIGNISIPGGADTVCPQCGNLLVTRSGYSTRIVGLKASTCARCGMSIPGVWDV